VSPVIATGKQGEENVILCCCGV